MSNFIKVKELISIIVLSLIFSGQAFAQNSHSISLYDNPKYPNNFKHFDYVNPDAPKGGEVRIAAIGTFDSLNPFILKGVPAEGMSLVFDTLMTSAADEPSTQYGLIAESVEMPKDRSWIVFNLRNNARFSDNSPITVDDVIFSFNTLKKKGHPQYKTIFREIISASKVDKDSVKFTFNSGDNRELPIIIGQLPVFSKKYFSENDFTKANLDFPVGSGAYRVSKVDPGRSIEFERLKNYWAKNLPVNIGRYNFDKVIVDYYRDATIAVEAFKAGEFDFRRENISKTWSKAYNMPEINDGRVIKETLVDGTPTGMQAFIFNIRKNIFKDRKFREALSYAYDFEWANEQLFYGAYSRNRSFFGNSEFEAKGLPSKGELKLLEPFRDVLPKEVFTKVYNPPVNDGKGNARANLLKARDILKESGYVLRDMKLINPHNNEPISIEFLIASPAFKRIIAPFISNLKKLGIESRIRLVDYSQYIKRRENFDFDIMVNWFTQGASPGTEQRDYWHSSLANVKGSKNFIGIENPVVDFLVEKIISAKSHDEHKIAANALDRVLQWNFYVIPQWYSRTHRVIYWSKLNRPKITPPFALGMIDSWWIDEKQ